MIDDTILERLRVTLQYLSLFSGKITQKKSEVFFGQLQCIIAMHQKPKKKINMIKQETDAWISWMLTACSGHNQVREECLLLIKQLIDVEKPSGI